MPSWTTSAATHSGTRSRGGRHCYAHFVLSRILTFLLLGLLLITVAPRETDGSSAASTSGRYIAVIVLDGFRPDYASLAPMRHLRWLMARGRTYDSAWAGQIEAETPASHATIATGAYPRVTSVIGFGWRDETTGGFTFMPTNVSEIKQGDLSRTIERGGVPTISDLIHARKRSDLTASMSGEKLWASAPMGTGADYVLYGWEVKNVKKGANKFRPIAVGNVPPRSTGYTSVSAPSSAFAYQDLFSAQLAVKMLGSLRPRAMFINLPAPDIAGHYYGGLSDPKDMRSIIQGTDRALGVIINEYKRLGIFKKTDFIIVSDHGMVDGHQRVAIHTVYKAVAHDGVSEQEEELQPSLGQIWLHDPQNAQMLATKLAAKHFNHIEGALYKVTDSSGSHYEAAPQTAAKFSGPLLQAYLDLADTEASLAGPEVVLPYQEDTTGLAPTKAFHGMHGGFSWDSQHIELVMEGPGIRKGKSHYPAQLVDIAPTIERLNGLPIPSGVNGVVLADGVQNATRAQTSAQKAVQNRRAADQKAIRAHSIAQLKRHE